MSCGLLSVRILFLTLTPVSRQELAGWLQHQIADQKRADVTTSGAAVITETALNMPIIKDTAAAPDVQLVLPDPRKQRKQSKQLYLEKGIFTVPIILWQDSDDAA